MSTQSLGKKWKITSLVDASNPPVGIADTGVDSLPVLLNQPDYSWTVTLDPTGHGDRFSIGEFPYTGVNKQDQNTVIATSDDDKNVVWFVNYKEYQKAYTVTKDFEETEGWTVDSASAPNNPIVVKSIIPPSGNPPQYSTSQLFVFSKAA